MTKSRTKIGKIPLWLAVVTVLVLGYAAIFGRSTAIVYRAKAEAAKNPALFATPVPLPDISASQEQARTENFYGFGFEVPWMDAQSKDSDSAALILSPSRQQAITFFDPAAEHGLVSVMRDTPGLHPELVYALYGAENMRSDYELTRKALHTSPADLSLLMPGSKQIQGANLLSLKKAYLEAPCEELYSFELGTLRGFEHGDRAHTRIVVDAYDAQDHKFTFVFSGTSDVGRELKQADVNRVLETLHPVDDDD